VKKIYRKTVYATGEEKKTTMIRLFDGLGFQGTPEKEKGRSPTRGRGHPVWSWVQDETRISSHVETEGGGEKVQGEKIGGGKRKSRTPQ